MKLSILPKTYKWNIRNTSDDYFTAVTLDSDSALNAILHQFFPYNIEKIICEGPQHDNLEIEVYWVYAVIFEDKQLARVFYVWESDEA